MTQSATERTTEVGTSSHFSASICASMLFIWFGWYLTTSTVSFRGAKARTMEFAEMTLPLRKVGA